MIVNLHIDRLVLDGLPVGGHEGPLVQAAVEAELARLLAEAPLGEMLPRGGTMPLVRTEPIAGAAGAAALGTQIGTAVFGGIGR